MTTAFTRHRLIAAAALSAILPTVGLAQEACTTYIVKDGDTLGSIAQTAYDTYDYQMIFNANRDKLSANFNDLPAGLDLILPCLDGRLTPDTQLGAIISGEDEAQSANRDASKAYQPPLRFVTGNGRFPFADESLTGGGALVRVATTALQRGGNDYKSTVAWVDDWRAQTEVLLPSGAFDIALPWLMPDCTKLDQLGAEAAERCTKFDKSVPVYELAFVLTTTADSAYVNARDYSDFAGARICQPKGWSSFPLEQVGLAEPVITRVRLGTPEECGEALLEGEVDALAMPIEASNDIFVKLDAMDRVVINPVLVQILSLHFLASKDNPRGKEYIEMLDRGIIEMRESGEWYDILATTLAEYQEQIQ